MESFFFDCNQVRFIIREFKERAVGLLCCSVAVMCLVDKEPETASRHSNYPTPPFLSDCRTAFTYLPSGTVPTLWYNKPTAGEERKVLPLAVHHGE